MNSQTEPKSENGEPRVSSTPARKPWVTPIVSKSPVNEVTLSTLGAGTFDGSTYS